MFKLFFLLALVAFVAVFAVEDVEKDLTESESHAFGYYRSYPAYWTGARYYGRYAYPGTYYRSGLGFGRYYNGLYL